MLRIALVLFVAWLGGSPAHAATFKVNSLLDTSDGTCAATPGGCTLREAIEASVATPGRDGIVFDPAVFPPAGFTGLIGITSPLPPMSDPAGTVVDGAGATVQINGGGQPHGLLFSTAAGVAIEKVTVANVLVLNVNGAAIEVCGGAPPACDDGVTGVLIQNVVVAGATQGIAVRGGVVAKVRVAGAVASNGAGGIFIGGSEALVGARVEGSSAPTIYLFGDALVSGATVVDSLASGGSTGVMVQSTQRVTGAKVADVVTFSTIDSGVRVVADGTTAGTKITNVVASTYGVDGVEVYGDGGNSGVAVKRVRADQGGDGVAVFGPLDGGKFQDLVLIDDVVGLDLSDPRGATNTKVTDVIAVDNAQGVLVVGGGTKLKNVHAAANAGAGIVISGTGGNVVEKSRASANNQIGIGTDSQANGIRKNVALGNDPDLADDHPTCDANAWQKNVFVTSSAPCIH